MNLSTILYSTRTLFFCLVVVLGLQPTHIASAATGWYVTPTGAGSQDGRSWQTAFGSIQAALDVAQPGDTIYLGIGDYFESIESKRHGTANAPISIVGSPGAVLRGSTIHNRIFQIFHDYYLLDGWTINGYDGSGNTASDYRDKLLYVHGQSWVYDGVVRRGPVGIEVRNMTFLNAGGECIRLRYFVQYANIHHNTFSNCGIYDFRFNGGGVNGEGIYIGTSSNQWTDGKNPTSDPDESNFNHIHHNTFNVQGNECVEVKEGGTNNLIEHNLCTGSLDPAAAGLVSRGNGNTFRYNTSYGHAGGGIRFGGHTINGQVYGINNDAYANTLYLNVGGGIKFEGAPQRTICGNIFVGPQGQSQAKPAWGSYGDGYTNQVSASCPTDTLPSPTATGTAQPSATPTSTNTATDTPSSTPTTTATDTLLPTATATGTAQPSATATPTPTNTATATSSSTPTATATDTLLPTATASETTQPSATPTSTNTATDTPSSTPTVSPTSTIALLATPALTATSMREPVSTEKSSNLLISTPSATPSPTATASPAETATLTATSNDPNSRAPVETATSTPTETLTIPATATPSPTVELSTPTDTPTLPPTPSPTPTIMGLAVIVISPNEPGEMVYRTPNGSEITIQIPSGAVDEPIQLIYNEPHTLPQATQGSFQLANRLFTLTAWQADLPQRHFTFIQPIVLEIRYLDEEVEGLEEDELLLYYYDEEATTWSTTGITVIERDPEQNRIVVQLEHLTEFALGAPSYSLYLPVITHQNTID